MKTVSSQLMQPQFNAGLMDLKNFHFSVDVDYVPGSEGGLEPIFEMCERLKLKPTFFITGKFAQVYPDQVRECKRRGYELGTHGWLHGEGPDEDFGEASLEEQRRLLAISRDEVERASGIRPRIFRAPNLWMNEFTLSALEQEGYLIDSSVPTRRFDLGMGQIQDPRYFMAPLKPYFPSHHHMGKEGQGRILELAPSAFFVPINMSALRVLGMRSVLWAIRRVHARSPLLVFYCHPAEFVHPEKLSFEEDVPKRHREGIGPQYIAVVEQMIESIFSLGYQSRFMSEWISS